MRVKFSPKTDVDFRKHRDYLRQTGKSDGHKYQKYELDGISNSLKTNISKGLENTSHHKDSIYPKEYEYNSQNYKMYVDKKSHHIIFYRIEKTKSGNSVIQIDKVIHSTELKRQLEEKGIEPLKNADPSLLDDLETIYKEDEVKSRVEPDKDKEGKEEEVYDEETGRKVKRVVYTGPKGGRYYKTDKGEKVYIDEKRIYKSLKLKLIESKITPLSFYIIKKELVQTAPPRFQFNGLKKTIPHPTHPTHPNLIISNESVYSIDQ